MARRNFLTCVYETDEGKQVLMRVDERYQSQDNGATPPVPLLGAVPATSTQRRTLVNRPSDLKPRSVLVATADGAFRGRIPFFTNDAYISIAMGSSITFYDGQGAAHAGLVEGKEGERSRHKMDVG